MRVRGCVGGRCLGRRRLLLGCVCGRVEAVVGQWLPQGLEVGRRHVLQLEGSAGCGRVRGVGQWCGKMR